MPTPATTSAALSMFDQVYDPHTFGVVEAADVALELVAAAFGHTPAEVLDELFDVCDEFAARAVPSSYLTEDVAARAAAHQSVDVQRRVLWSPAVPTDVLEAAASSWRDELREAAAAHPSMPVAGLAVLAHDPAVAVREGVARNPALPAGLARELDGSGDGDVHAELARNPATPTEILARYCADNTYLALTAVENPSTPPDVLEATARSRDEKLVLAGICANPATPLHVVEQLAASNSEIVSSTAKRRLHACEASAPL